MGALVEVPFPEVLAKASPDLREMMLDLEAQGAGRRFWHHAEGSRVLTVQYTVDHHTLEDAFRYYLNVRHWKHLSVSVEGHLQAALDDQRRLGRKRRGGERSPVPLPDWYDLTHLAYDHAAEVGFDPRFPVWQYLPASDELYLNIAEALHLKQPA